MENNYKKVYLKDLIKNKSYDELMKLIPCMICIEKGEGELILRDSYHLLGFSKEAVILGYNVVAYEDEPFWGDGYYNIPSCKVISFKELENPKVKYIYTREPTDNQIAVLEKYDKYNEDISMYEAWYIINDIASENNKKYYRGRR